MADTLTTTTVWTDFVETAFDTAVNWYLNDMVWFRSLVDKRPVSQAMPGDTVTLSIHKPLPTATTALTEGVDVDAQAMVAPRRVSVTLQEYGNVVMSTEKLTRLAFTQTVLQDIAQEIATNLNESIDLVYKAIFDAAANKLFVSSTGTFSTTGTSAASTTLDDAAAAAATTISTVGNAGIAQDAVIQIGTGSTMENRTVASISGSGPYTVTLTTALSFAHADGETVQPLTLPGTITALSVATTDTLLRRRKAPTRDGANYAAYIHPDVGLDLRTEVGNIAWQNPHQYVDTSNIYTAEIGAFHGVRFIETPRCLVIPGTPNTYNTYVLSREAVVECVAVEPEVRIGAVVDKLKRNQPIGWYALLGANRFRENCLQIIRTKSSLGSLATTVDPAA